jgi:TatD DNase family protein
VLVDCHAHPQFHPNSNNILEEWSEHQIFVSSTNFEDFRYLQDLQRQYNFIQVTIGLHPWCINHVYPKQEITQLLSILESNKYCIGEIGLDYSRKYKLFQSIQNQVFIDFLEFAIDVNRPVVLHMVKAHHRWLELLKRYNTKFYLHSFNGKSELIEAYVDRDAYFGVSASSNNLEALCGSIPLDKILIESDGLLSVNDFKSIVVQVSQLFDISPTKMEQQLHRNAIEFFHF